MNGDPWKHFHHWSIQAENLEKVTESRRKCICWTHKGVLCQCHCGRRPHQLLGATKGTHYHKEFHLSQSLYNMMTDWTLLSLWQSSLVVFSRRSQWTLSLSMRRWGHWPMSWFTTSTWWRTWQHCPNQEPFSYMISSPIRRSTYAVIYTTSWPRVSPKGTQGQYCHS